MFRLEQVDFPPSPPLVPKGPLMDNITQMISLEQVELPQQCLAHQLLLWSLSKLPPFWIRLVPSLPDFGQPKSIFLNHTIKLLYFVAPLLLTHISLTFGNSIPFPFCELITRTSNSNSSDSFKQSSPPNLYLYGIHLQDYIVNNTH